MNEHPFYNELSLVLVNTYAPKNKFQELVCKMLSPLHGIACRIGPTPQLSSRTASQWCGAASRCQPEGLLLQYRQTRYRCAPSPPTCRAAVISDVIKGTRVGNEVATVYFHPVQGILKYLNKGGTQRMQPVMSGKVSAEWLAQYVDMVEKGGEA